MSLVLNEDQQLLRNSAAEFLAAEAPVSRFRSLRDQDKDLDGDTWQQAIEFGWPAILVPEALDGLNFGLTGLGLLAIEHGKSLVLSPLLSSAGVAVSALLQCTDSARRDQLIREIASGDSIVAFAHQESHRASSQDVETIATKSANDWVLSGSKKCVASGGHADYLLLSAREEATDEVRLYIIDVKADGLSRGSIGLIDANNYANITLSQVEISAENALTWTSGSASGLAAINHAGALLTACELYGVSQAGFDQTLAYLGDREQFGQKIGSFQALQHRMAHAYSSMELLKSVIYDALGAVESNRKDAAIAVSHAKALANDVAKLVTTEAIQMHGGIGITDELDIGLFYKRARVLRSQWGDSVYHRRRFAELNGY